MLLNILALRAWGLGVEFPQVQLVKYKVLTFNEFMIIFTPSIQLLHSPNDFTVAADRLCSRLKQKKQGLEAGEHICFLGSGREQEDQYVTMVVAKFLQKSIPYVSLARGGFLGEGRVEVGEGRELGRGWELGRGGREGREGVGEGEGRVWSGGEGVGERWGGS